MFVKIILLCASLFFILHCGHKVIVYCDTTGAANNCGIKPTPIPVDTTAPSLAGEIFVSNIASTTVTASWTQASDAVTAQANLEYKIVYGPSGTPFVAATLATTLPTGVVLVQDWSKNITTTELTNLTAETSYQIAVLARDQSLNTSMLGPKIFTTNSLSAPTTGSVITFSAIKSTTLTLTWGVASDLVTTNPAFLEYKVVKSTDAANINTANKANEVSDAEVVLDWSQATLSHKITSLLPGTTYNFAVLVKNKLGNISLYSPATVTTLANDVLSASDDIYLTDVTATSMNLHWGAATGGSNSGLLTYKIVKANNAASIDTVSKINNITGNDLLQDWGIRDSSGIKAVNTLSPLTTYFFAILVKDALNNMAIYSPKRQVTLASNDTVAPTAVIATTSTTTTKVSPIPFTIVFSESVSDFDSTDLAVTNGLASAVSGSGASYSFTVTPTADGDVSVVLAADKVSDLGGNKNTVSNTVTVTFDTTGSTPTLSGVGIDSNFFNTATQNIAISFSEAVTGFVITDLVVTNASIDNFSGSNNLYLVTLTPTANGAITITLAANSAVDSVNNPSLAASLNLTYDNVAPSLGSVSSGGTTTSLSQAPTATWSAATDSTSGVASYEVALGTSAGGTNIKTWTNIGNVLTYTATGLTLTNSAACYTSVRAVDYAGNASASSSSSSWQVTAP